MDNSESVNNWHIDNFPFHIYGAALLAVVDYVVKIQGASQLHLSWQSYFKHQVHITDLQL
jgi:hypothetical protein